MILVINTGDYIPINKFQVNKMLVKGLIVKDLAEILGISKAEVEAMSHDVIKDKIHELDFLESKKVTIIPLLGEQIRKYYSRTLRIEDEDLLYWLVLQQRIDCFGLGEIYVALKMFSGTEGLKNYDLYKMSFRFPFLLKIKKNDCEEESEYLLMVQDFKGGLEFPFYKIISENEIEKFKNKLDVYNKPFAEELTRNEMNEIIGYIVGYIEGVTENINDWYDGEFSHYVEEIRLKYGFKDGSFYQYQEKDEEKTAES